VSWHTFDEAAPEFAATVRGRLEDGPYALLGTIRADGHPRISGVIVTFSDHELWLGMPADALKIADLRREPKMSLHSAVSASATAEGDVKVTGRAVSVSEDDAEFREFADAWPHAFTAGTLAVFRIEVEDASRVRLAETHDHHVIESWRAGEQGTRTVRSFP
jgi:nitroimidazol reductase NimA-like FMN-containing flavoprotein (pyridoxamine 5'-phosphate oxidase superfamily)